MSSPTPKSNMPIDMKDQVMKYTGNSKTTAQFLRQIKTSFASSGIELTPSKFFDVNNLRVSDDSNLATEDDVVMCKDLLRTRFAPIEHNTKTDWMADLRALKQEKSESLIAHFNRASTLLKNLELVDGKSENTTAELHLLSTVCMACYTGLYNTILKRRILQVKGWSKCTSLSKMHTLVVDEEKDMEQEEQVEHHLKDAECAQMLQGLRSGTVSQTEFNSYLSSVGSLVDKASSFSAQTSSSTSALRNLENRRSDQTNFDPHHHNNRQTPKHLFHSLDAQNSSQNPHLSNQHQQPSNQHQGSRDAYHQNRPTRVQNYYNSNLNQSNPNWKKVQVPADYDRTRSSNPYINGSKVLQGEQVCVICGLSGHVAARDGQNCPPRAAKLDLIESAILRSLLFPNDRNVESNMNLIRSRYYDFTGQTPQQNLQDIPQFIPDNIDSHMISFDEESIGTQPDQLTNPVLDMNQIDTDVFAYELAGPKRVRINDDENSDSERDRVQRAARANEREIRELNALRGARAGKATRRPEIGSGTQDINQKYRDSSNENPSTQGKRKGCTRLRTIVGREGKGPLDYKKMLDDTMVTMSMIDFYQASPDFVKCSRMYSTRINEKRVNKKRAPIQVTVEEEEEILMLETTSSSTRTTNTQSRRNKSHPVMCNSTMAEQLPEVNLISKVAIRTTARKDRAFRIP
ncbi:hypothetical protein K3495_g9351 [Podosphaera aphanis]|nr:hypothetical protein K3495_g9351 [Podosphaera aphanis]